MMTTPSPADFLTFFRYTTMASRSLLRASAPPRAIRSAASTSSPFHSATPALAYGYPKSNKSDPLNLREDAKHSTRKYGDDPQSEGSHLGKRAKRDGGTDNTTAERDTTGAAAKAKREHPEAPTTIGMEDERGGKGA